TRGDLRDRCDGSISVPNDSEQRHGDRALPHWCARRRRIDRDCETSGAPSIDTCELMRHGSHFCVSSVARRLQLPTERMEEVYALSMEVACVTVCFTAR